jgi:hypothetical protein
MHPIIPYLDTFLTLSHPELLNSFLQLSILVAHPPLPFLSDSFALSK